MSTQVQELGFKQLLQRYLNEKKFVSCCFGDEKCCPALTSGAPQREVYFMGLIDVLTQYDTKKKAAHAAKTVKHGVSDPRDVPGSAPTAGSALILLCPFCLPQAGAEISTVHPEQYAKRFRDFISNIFA